MRRPGRGWMVVAALVGVLASACSGSGSDLAETAAATAAAAARAATATTEPVPATVTTRAPAPTTTAVATTVARITTPTTPLPGLGIGARGAEVAALEQRLDALHYDVGKVDDVYDQNTAYGVTAFQKVQGMDRTGRATDDVIAALATAKPPAALVPDGGADRVEVDIPRQVLFLWKGGALVKVLTISSGSNQRFCSEGWCRTAVTPGGSYAFYRQGRGWEEGPLGSLYNPAYFNGGIAVHGAQSVPAHPASHGCIRIPMSAAEWFPGQITMGMPVHVVGVDGQPPTPGQLQNVPSTTAPPAVAPPPTAAPATTSTTVGLLGGLLGKP